MAGVLWTAPHARRPEHRPGHFLRNKQARALIAELGGLHKSVQAPVSTVNDGANNGTYVAKELVYAYAMWISWPSR